MVDDLSWMWRCMLTVDLQVLRHVDIGPGITSPMHRTVSLDYGIVIEGEIELLLDSGEKRQMLPGDICVQRGTMVCFRLFRV